MDNLVKHYALGHSKLDEYLLDEDLVEKKRKEHPTIGENERSVENINARNERHDTTEKNGMSKNRVDPIVKEGGEGGEADLLQNSECTPGARRDVAHPLGCREARSRSVSARAGPGGFYVRWVK